MAETNTNKIKHKFNRTFAKIKVKIPRWTKSTYTEEELLEIRKMFNIIPKDERDPHGYKGGYQRPL